MNHIKKSVDVDLWAVEEVEKVFNGIDDAIAEIDKEIDAYKDGGSGNAIVIYGLEQARRIISEHTGIGEQNETN